MKQIITKKLLLKENISQGIGFTFILYYFLFVCTIFTVCGLYKMGDSLFLSIIYAVAGVLAGGIVIYFFVSNHISTHKQFEKDVDTRQLTIYRAVLSYKLFYHYNFCFASFKDHPRGRAVSVSFRCWVQGKKGEEYWIIMQPNTLRAQAYAVEEYDLGTFAECYQGC